jgi:hypothetical protein
VPSPLRPGPRRTPAPRGRPVRLGPAAPLPGGEGDDGREERLSPTVAPPPRARTHLLRPGPRRRGGNEPTGRGPGPSRLLLARGRIEPTDRDTVPAARPSRRERAWPDHSAGDLGHSAHDGPAQGAGLAGRCRSPSAAGERGRQLWKRANRGRRSRALRDRARCGRPAPDAHRACATGPDGARPWPASPSPRRSRGRGPPWARSSPPGSRPPLPVGEGPGERAALPACRGCWSGSAARTDAHGHAGASGAYNGGAGTPRVAVTVKPRWEAIVCRCGSGPVAAGCRQAEDLGVSCPVKRHPQDAPIWPLSRKWRLTEHESQARRAKSARGGQPC